MTKVVQLTPALGKSGGLMGSRVLYLVRHGQYVTEDRQKPSPRKELAEIREVADTLTKRFFTAPRGKKCRTELIVAHGNLIRYLVRLAMGDSAVDWWKMGTFNCSLTRLQIQQEGPNFLIQFNDIGHLPTSMQTTM